MYTVILAGGNGTRLKPITEHTPKPLVKVGGKPIIEWNLEYLTRAGYTHPIIVTREAHYSKYKYLEGRNVTLFASDTACNAGNAGCLGYLNFDEDTLVTVGDTIIDYQDHLQQLKSMKDQYQAKVAMLTRRYTQQIPFGVVQRMHYPFIDTIVEKPTHDIEYSLGIMIFDKSVMKSLADICKREKLDIPQLVNECNPKVGLEYKLDRFLTVNTLEELGKAREEIAKWK